MRIFAIMPSLNRYSALYPVDADSVYRVSIRGRAATPATVFLLAAFVLLFLSCISVPITKTIALGSYNGATFGVFGFCVNGVCSPVQLGYNPGTFHPPYTPILTENR